MRRSVQPNCPRAMTCRFFASLKMFAMPAEGRTPPPPRQRLERLLPMAGFQLSIYGRFWVSTEVVVPERGDQPLAAFTVDEPVGGRGTRARQRDEGDSGISIYKDGYEPSRASSSLARLKTCWCC